MPVNRHLTNGLAWVCLGLALAPLFAAAAARGQDSPRAVRTLVFRVQVPPDTPADATLYLAGNAVELGEWRPDGVPLVRKESGEYEVRREFPRDASLEFKVTRGTWETVEKGEGGRERGNRRHRVDKDAEIEIQVVSWAEAGPPPPSTATGNLRAIEVYSPQLENRRRVTIWLPPGYEDRVDNSYPVLYFLDGQNVFDDRRAAFGVEWRVDETLAQLIETRAIEPWIVVAIDNSPGRTEEYTPNPFRGRGGRAAKFAEFLIETVKPMIDRQFRTRPERESTAIAGSSLGGLFSLYAVAEHGDVFSRAMAMSPSLFWDNEQLLNSLADPADAQFEQPLKIWIDTGDREGGDGEEGRELNRQRLERLHAALVDRGLVPGEQLEMVVAPGGVHNEAAWAERLPRALTFVLSTR